jgi:hypothetical protein
MTTASAYARALFAAQQEHPEQGAKQLKNLKALLIRRGHASLLPRIYAEYKKLSLREERLESQKRVSPQAERTRVLLELYRTLIQ